jgi:hypothetical protein
MRALVGLCDLGKGVGRVELEMREDHLVLCVPRSDIVIMCVQVSTDKPDTRQLTLPEMATVTDVKVSHPPFPLPARSTGRRIPTAPLLPIPPYQSPNLEPSGLPIFDLMVDSRPNSHSATPQWDSLDMRKYRSAAFSSESDLA